MGRGIFVLIGMLDPTKVTLLRRAYTILKRLHADHVLDGITLPHHWHDSPAAMLTEYHDDHPIVPGSPQLISSVPIFLDFATQLTARLCEVHTRKIRYGSLRPENITISPEGKVWLHDFTCASLLFNGEKSGETRAEPDYLPYLPPESTGRINRRVDYRSDFYSLGATLFHIITGNPLWADANSSSLNFVMDELSIANRHVTQTPPSTNFHPAVDAVIAKLLAKMPEHRYQSCEGLLSDWKDIQSSPSSPFIAGKADQASRFMIPQGLYGRDPEKARLVAMFEQMHAKPFSKVIFLKGYAGVGKSALVKESVTTMLEYPNTIYCQGKFDQTNRVPFSAIVQALSELTRQILTESAANLETWRQSIRSALEEEVAVLLPVLPDLAHVLGVHNTPSVPDLEDPYSQEERQKRVLVNFLRIFAQKKAVVMFMDDLQWSSKSDLQLLAALIQDFSSSLSVAQETEPPVSMLLICAYRDNVVDSQHPVHTVFENKVECETMELHNLRSADTGRLVSDTLHRKEEECSHLTKLIYARCRGNPFFIERVHTVDVSICLW
jgi:AAA ATPase domain/Protein kinase domain